MTAQNRTGLLTVRRRSPAVLEWAALLACIAFFPLGLCLLWISSVFTRRQKVIATVIPMGLFVLLYLALFVASKLPSSAGYPMLNIHPQGVVLMLIAPIANPFGLACALYLRFGAWQGQKGPVSQPNCPY